jgi:hypothetical protein
MRETSGLLSNMVADMAYHSLKRLKNLANPSLITIQNIVPTSEKKKLHLIL